MGAPNVGKSALFNRLTGRYATVSNYPGTSVEIARGAGTLGGVAAEVIDTPGLYSLVASSEEERVTQGILLDGGVDVTVHVIDAKNLARSLPFTLQLAELGRPLVVANDSEMSGAPWRERVGKSGAVDPEPGPNGPLPSRDEVAA